MKPTYRVGHKFGNRYFVLPRGLTAFGKALLSPRVAASLAYVLLLMIGPQFAHAEPWDDGANSILDGFRSIMRPVAIIAIIVLGCLAFFGQLAAKTAAMAAGGIFITVGADAIYDYFSGAVGG